VLEDDPSTTDFTEIAYCKCDENSLPYEFNGRKICTPKCENHSNCPEGVGACIKGQCNERNECTEDSDCPTTDICYRGGCYNDPTGGK
jgi:hypothetical protein